MGGKKYGIRTLQKQFPNDDVILDFIFRARHSDKCSCGGTYRRVKGRKQYQCSTCRFQIAPTAGTIFHKSDTPLTIWLHAILVFSNAKSGISAKQMQRELEVTYKTAWRMLHLIRKALPKGHDPLTGMVEIDTGVIGGRARQGEYMINKSTAFAAIQRDGETRAQVMQDGSAKSHKHFIWQNISTDSTLITDSAQHYKHAAEPYKREAVNHSKKEYVRGAFHINRVESFWSHVKRSIKGTHKHVSPKHLQTYLDGFVFHANNRGSDSARFAALLGALLQPAK